LSTASAGIAFVTLLVAALMLVHVPLGDYMYRVYTSSRNWRVERAIYRIIGADPKVGQPWDASARSILAFSAVSVLSLFFFELLQDKLPLLPPWRGTRQSAS
jgi:potassium-transporting ATPase potassium-binding subunit